MIVLHFAEHQANFVDDNNGGYFLWQDEQGVPQMLPASCPHRGGPLWLGSLEDDKIRCPWHDTRVSVSSLQRRALPMVINRGVVTAVAQGNTAHLRVVTGVDGGPPCQARKSPPCT